VTHYVIDVHHDTHTCPGNPQPHIVHTRRTIVATEPGGPCTRPTSFVHNGQVVTVACARAVRAAQQCPACRITITIRHTITTDLGPIPQVEPKPQVPALVKDPCPSCGLPVAGILADTGRHLLCPPAGGQR
jgi:hypothetical protein